MSSDSDNQRVIAFVGEAPAKQEIAKGTPFVGASGQLLTSVLDQYGVSREDVVLTNATLCHYPESMKKMPKEAIECCRPRLLSELKDNGVTTVVPMGNSAVQSVFPPTVARKGITALRVGLPKVSEYLDPSTDVVPTFHPAACLRSQEKTPYLLTDIAKAVSADYLPKGWYEPSWEVIDESTKAFALLHEIIGLNRGEEVFLDIEVGAEKDVSFGNVHMQKMLCIGIGPSDIKHRDNVFVFTSRVFDNANVRREFMRLLEVCRVVCQNGKYDIGVLRQWLGYEDFTGPILAGDTMLLSYTLNEYGGVHSLEFMGQEFLGAPNWKHEIDPYLRGPDGKGEVDYGNIPPDILHKYNAFDVHVTRLLYAFFRREVESLGLDQAYQFMLQISAMLILVERRGMGFDIPYSETLSGELTTERDGIEATLPIVSDPDASTKALRQPHPLNCNSPKQVTQYMATHGVKLETTESDVLKELLLKHEIKQEAKDTIEKILRIRAITKTDGTFVGGMRKRVTEAGTVHPSFLIHGTTSGRLSARNPNSQNISRAKEIKRQFISSSPARTLVGVDMSQAELRVLTFFAREEVTQEIFNDPSRDLFTELTLSMFSQDSWDSWTEAQRKEVRTLVKTFAYGMAYGRTASGIAADPDFHMDVKTAQKHMNTFKLTIPRITDYLEMCADKACRGEPLVTPFGRHRRFHLVTFLNEHAVRNEAKSFPAQSTASDIVLEAAYRLTFDHHVPIINLVHDAIYAEVPHDEAAEVAELISKVMIATGEEVTESYVKFATDAKIGATWANV